MVYTNNVPQSTQTIASTQPLIQANFAFLETSIDTEHNFDATDATKTYHNKASMPNMADPVALPSGTNGMYYVSGGLPKYYDTTAAQVGGKLLTACNAYIQFNGSGSVGPLNAGGNSIRSSYNIDAATSVKTATGLYTITFTNALPSANYCVLITGMRSTSGEVFGFVQGDTVYGNSVSTTSVKIGFQSTGGSNRDVILGSVYIFGA